jgi:hypothetical protein
MSTNTLVNLVEEVKRQMTAITGLSPDAISRLDRAEGGWTVSIDMLEHRSIPRTQDLLASYEVTLAGDGQVTGWHRTGRFIRGQG